MAKKQVKRKKIKRLKRPSIRRAVGEWKPPPPREPELPKYLQEPDKLPVLTLAFWARQDVLAERVRFDDALDIVEPRLQKLIRDVEGKKLEWALGHLKTFHQMDLARRKADQEHVVALMQCKVHEALTIAQLEANLQATPGTDRHPADFGHAYRPPETATDPA